MSKQQLPDTENLEVARLGAALGLATAHKSTNFNQLLRRFKRAYQATLPVAEELEKPAKDAPEGGLEVIATLPPVEVPASPLPDPPKLID